MANCEDMCQKHSGVIEKLETHDREIKHINVNVDKLLYRLPNWAVFAISLLTGALGWTVKLASM